MMYRLITFVVDISILSKLDQQIVSVTAVHDLW